jgi:WD40 repeat protein/DNA-binding SARP family transcriptional activator
MAIAVLGPVTIEGEGEDGRLGPRDRVVLAALAVRPGEVMSADRLADALWGDTLPGTWSKVVQGCVMRLRKVLGADAIETSRLGYRLVVSAEELDTSRFERLVGRARELLTLGEPERATYVLNEAMSLWRGPAFAELEGWDKGRIAAARLDELRRDAEELGVDAALRAGHSREVLATAHALVVQAPLRERRWSLLALAQYQVGRQAEALRTLRQVRTLLSTELGLDPGPDLVALEQAILRQDPALVAEIALPEPSATCPYQGLLPYGVADGESFFGRDADIAGCLARLAANGVLVVVGPSGSGKSSLVRAGVAAALERDGGRVVVVTPGAHPLDPLTAASSSRRSQTLVVDQCEEAVTLCVDPAEQAEFFGRLAEHAERGGLVVALRADRIGELSAHPSFARLVERGLYLLGVMGADELRACIEGPAHQAGLLLEPGLVDLLVREVEGEPGALPLLSHALRETWAQREGRTLTVAGYQATGGIRSAVARSAEEVYERVDPQHRPIVRDLLLRLVAPNTGGEPVRSRMPRRMVADDAPHQEIIEMLVGARLVTTDDGVLELAHEALARAWPRLRQWLDDDTEGQRILRHLSAAADAWDSMGRPDSELYRGVRLAQALDWREQSRPELTAAEQSFLESSHALVDAEVRTAREQAQVEARARRRTRRLAIGLAVALALAVVAAGVATRYQRAADDRAAEAAEAGTAADANRLAALSTTVGSLDLSLLLAAEAMRTAETPATQDGLLASLVQHRRATRVVQLGGRPFDGGLADRGRTLFASMEGAVLAWSVGSSEPPREVVSWPQPYDIAASPHGDLVALSNRYEDAVRVGVFASDGTERLLLEGADEIGGHPYTFGFSADGRRVFMAVSDASSGTARGSIREIEVETGHLVRVLPAMSVRSDHDYAMWANFADDGSVAVMWSLDTPRATLVDLTDGSRTRLRVEQRAASHLGFVPLATGAAQRWSDGAVTLYDRRGFATQTLDTHVLPVSDLVVAPDGTWAASADEDGQVFVWNVDADTGLWSQRESLVGHDGAVSAIAVDPSGETLVTLSHDRTAISWDLSSEAGFGSPLPGLGDRWISNRPEAVTPGELVVAPTRPAPPSPGESSGVSVAALFLDPRTGAVVDKVVVGNTAENLTFGSSVAVSPDRTKVAVTYGVGTVVLDTRTRQELARIVLDDIDQFGGRSPEFVWCAAWTPDGSRLLLCAEGKPTDVDDGGLVVVDAVTWEPRRSRVDLGGAAQTIERSPDGRWFAVGMTIPPVEDAPPGSALILDAQSLDVDRRLDLGDGNFTNDLSVSPDKRLLAVGSIEGELSVIDIRSGRPLHEPAKVHNGFVQQVEWLPDGRTVVSTGEDGTVTLYDVQRGLVRATLPGSSDLGRGYTYLVSVTSEQITAVTGEHDWRIYSLTPSRWLDYACVVAGRDLTRGEWASYLPGRDYRRTCGDRG